MWDVHRTCVTSLGKVVARLAVSFGNLARICVALVQHAERRCTDLRMMLVAYQTERPLRLSQVSLTCSLHFRSNHFTGYWSSRYTDLPYGPPESDVRSRGALPVMCAAGAISG